MAPFDALRPRLVPARPLPARPGVLETSVAVLLASGDAGLEVLLIRRAVRADDPWSGHIGLPGGRRDPGDADLLDTALRETHEEIGIAPPREALLGSLDDVQPSIQGPTPLLIRPFVFGLKPRPVAGTSAEVSAVYWVPLQPLHAARGETTVALKGKDMPVPCFLVPGPGGLVVWGLTYRILGGLLPLLG